MTTHPPLLALGFSSPLILLWLAAAAVPLLLHLWRRRRYRETPWAAMEYLLAAIRSRRRRMRIEQLILLAVRTLLVILLVLALAELYVTSDTFLPPSRQRVHKLLVIDGSYSMTYAPGEQSLFDRAKALAIRLVEDGSRQGDAFSLVMMSSPPVPVVRTPTFGQDDFVDELNQLELRQSTGDLGATIQVVEDILRAADTELPEVVRHEVYFISDLGRVSWAPSEEAQGVLGQRLTHLAESAQVVVVDLGQPGIGNVAVSRLAAADPIVVAGRAASFTATVQSFGNSGEGPVRLGFYVDDRRVEERSVPLRPGEQTSATFSYRFGAPGPHRATVRLSGDKTGLALDDQRFLAIDVKQHVRVLAVAGRPGECRDVVRALAPAGGESSLVHAEIVNPSALSERELSTYDCIFLCNVGRIDASEARRLDRYARGGGAVVIFLGDQVVAESYNRHLYGDAPDAIRLLPTRIGPQIAGGTYLLDPADYAHPIVRPFRDRPDAGLRTARVYKYFRLERPERVDARVALRLSGTASADAAPHSGGATAGDPAIVEAPSGAGRTVLFATAPSMPSPDDRNRILWSSLPTSPAFLPIIQETWKYATAGQSSRLNVIVGDSIGDRLPAGPDPSLRITTPGGDDADVTLSGDGESAHWSTDATWHCGMYRVKSSHADEEGALYAVNLDTVESDLNKIDPSELPAGVRLYDGSAAPEGDSPATYRPPDRPLHRWLLYGVLALLLSETALAWWFGQRSA